jgi:hypothetical protein
MEKLFLAESTLDGIKKIKSLDVVKNKKDLKVLNMSELTSLAYEIPFTPLTNQPMWFHQTVSIFDKEVEWFCDKVAKGEYDLVIFESVSPKEVINFYPEDVHKCLDEHYKFEFSFLAPQNSGGVVHLCLHKARVVSGKQMTSHSWFKSVSILSSQPFRVN